MFFYTYPDDIGIPAYPPATYTKNVPVTIGGAATISNLSLTVAGPAVIPETKDGIYDATVPIAAGDQLTLDYSNGTSKTFTADSNGLFYDGEEPIYLHYAWAEDADPDVQSTAVKTPGTTYDANVFIRSANSSGSWICSTDTGGGKIAIPVTIADHSWAADYTIDKEATCSEEGSKAIYCTVCGAKDETSVTTIPKAGHSWTVAYKWSSDNKSVTATATCRNNASHKETETVKTTSKVTKKATYTAMGQTTYTAKFTKPAFKTQTKVLTNVAKLVKKNQPMQVKTAVKKVKAKKLKKKAIKVSPITVTNPKGKVTYTIVKGKAKAKKALKLNKNTGKITVKKKTKKGTYKLKVKVTAAGTSAGAPQYKAGSKTVWITVKVK